MPGPTIITITPPDGLPAGGTSVLVYGTSLTSVVAVTFGVTTVAFTIDTVNYLTTTSPPGSGTVELTVTDALGNTASLPFTYTTPPTISSISPTTGTTAGGTVVFVTGTLLNSVVAVTFGTTPATFAIISSTLLSTTSPPGSGTVELTVADAFGNTAASPYAYIFVPINLFGIARLLSTSAITAHCTVTKHAIAKLHSTSAITANGLSVVNATATLQSTSAITANGLSALLATATLQSTSAIIANSNEKFAATAKVISRTVIAASTTVTHNAIARLLASPSIHATAINLVFGQAFLLDQQLPIHATGIRIQGVVAKGGAKIGGVAVVATPVIFYIPVASNTYISFVGHSPANQTWEYNSSGTINFAGNALVTLGSRYVPQGDISFLGQVQDPSFVLLFGYNFTWQLNQAATASFGFYWDLGTQRQYWYRVVGSQSVNNCLGVDNCCNQLLMTIQAASINEVCSKIQSQFGVWPIQSIQRFLQPAETAAIAADALNGITYNCNTLEDLVFCNVPQCAALCVEFGVQENFGFTSSVTITSSDLSMLSLSLPQSHKASGGLNFGKPTKCQLHAKAISKQTTIKFTGSTLVKSSNYNYASNGLFKLRGMSKISVSHWRFRGCCTKNVDVANFDIGQVGHGTSWHIGDTFTNDLASGPSRMLMFSNLQFKAPVGIDAKLSGVIFSFNRFANGFIKDAEVVTLSGDRVLRKLTSQINWPLAIPTPLNLGSGNETLGFMPGEPFALGIRIEPVVLRDRLLAQVSNPNIRLVYDLGGKIRLKGSAPARTNFLNHESCGSVSFGGNAKSRFARKKPKRIPTPIIQTNATSRSKELVFKALSTGSDNFGILPMPQAEVTALTPPTTTINSCLCTTMPLSLTFSHNLVTANKFQQFLQRNGITFSNYITIEYNIPNNSWQANFHYQGASSAALNAEMWTMVFELQCTNLLGGTEIGSNVWRFAIKITQRNLLTNEAFQTRLMVAFLPDNLCNNGLNFSFTLNFDTQLQLATIDPSSTIYEMIFYDAIGLFKTATWITSPNLLINMTQVVVPQPRYPFNFAPAPN
jgi:hypothetical protein